MAVTDLTLGPARGHHVAREIAEQLGVSLPDLGHQATDDSTQNIEDELHGHVGRRAAFALAESLAEPLRRGRFWVVVLAPLAEATWGDANLALIELLADMLRASVPRVVIVRLASVAMAPVPAHWTLLEHRLRRTLEMPVEEQVANRNRFSPGLLPLGAAVVRSGGVVTFRTALGARFIEMCHRPQRQESTRRPASVATRLQSAEDAAVQGDLAFAIHRAETAYRLARGEERRATVLYPLQIYRIRAARFEEAARAVFPFVGIRPELLRQLLGCTGYAAAMAGDPMLARWFVCAANPSIAPHEWPDLFSRNSLALALARGGDVAGALDLLQSVLAESRQARTVHHHLVAITALNIARVHRQLEHKARTANAVQLWAREIEGHATTSELLYGNLFRARMAFDADAKNTLMHWMRAALHWVAQSHPECMGWRAASAILRRRVEAADVDAICDVFQLELMQAAEAAEVRPVTTDGAPTYAYVPRICDAVPHPLTAIQAPGLGLLASTRRIAPAYDTTAHRRLRRTLSGLLVRLVGSKAAAPTYLLDADLGYDLPSTLNGVVDSAARCGARALVHDHTVFAFDDAAQRAWRKGALVQWSAAVDDLLVHPGGSTVRFKRNRPPLLLDRQEADLVRSVRWGVRLQGCVSHTVELARELERLGVLRLYTPAGAAAI
ncbi:hypothetical protein HZ992_12310 [Rhizobacter sp. AJA081-3]|uniref:hypothetical protein n=1 Tax=Rhizobacter sp. AJA081-3 TaxID=2753607 RepID=UPI001AE04000|nr:hypothetical protein [Rhizobacter sp. AJA081-3]QTN25682.1 hypothetical protein HZ992_12310 [Rhizobacter sp. AJA081-3]